MTDQYAVIGNPIEHSKSPDIHATFASQSGQDLTYGKILSPLEQFNETVDAFVSDGGKGLNITVPFKEEAYQKADSLSKRARQAGAVNTFIITNGEIKGDNTDGVGMINDIKNNQGWEIAGKRVLLVGAGGAVRGVLGPLLDEKPQQVTICNRTVEKAVNLAQAFKAQGTIKASSFEALADEESFDLIINGTSASLAGELPPLPASIVKADTACYDMMYSKALTPFLAWSKNLGAKKLADGLGMLVEQAAEAFYLWRGVRVETQKVIESLRNS